VEIELKFQIPPRQRAAVRRAVATASARVTHLQAVYADTPDRRLAAAGLALRLRREGPRWVQTLKGPGDGIAQRLEHEVVLPPADEAPLIDPSRHAGSAAGARLDALLAGPDELVEVLRTDIRRLHRRVRSGGAVIEIALDQGELLAGGRRAAVNEIEFELIAGPPAALPAFAERWVQRHGLWWDVRTKAERGERLGQGVERVAAVKAAPSPVAPEGDTRSAFVAMVQASLAHALPNLAEIAGGTGAPEHLHQLRVGLRRLRTVLREFADWSGDPDRARALEAAWRAPFARLGASRDLDAIGATLMPQLSAAGAPALVPPPAGGTSETPAELVRTAAVTLLLLRSLALAMPTAGTPAASLSEAASDPLRRAWRRALVEAERFEQVDPPAQHRTRKRLKRLRYAFEFLMPLYAPKPARRLQRALAAGAEALGYLNDLHVAQLAYEAMRDSEPRAWFALGWLAAERRHAIDAAARSLRALAATPRPWRERGRQRTQGGRGVKAAKRARDAG
jgi:inorganic triphosphatase YgiF